MKHWYLEWHYAEKDGDIEYAKICKEKYRQAVIVSRIRSYRLYDDRMKKYPMLFIN